MNEGNLRKLNAGWGGWVADDACGGVDGVRSFDGANYLAVDGPGEGIRLPVDLGAITVKLMHGRQETVRQLTVKSW
jgi:hypothetical protein